MGLSELEKSPLGDQNGDFMFIKFENANARICISESFHFCLKLMNNLKWSIYDMNVFDMISAEYHAISSF